MNAAGRCLRLMCHGPLGRHKGLRLTEDPCVSLLISTFRERHSFRRLGVSDLHTLFQAEPAEFACMVANFGELSDIGCGFISAGTYHFAPVENITFIREAFQNGGQP
jgi:hypothetical protein